MRYSMHDTYSVPLFAIWPTSIVGNARPRSRVCYEALKPFSAISPCFDVPNVRRLHMPGMLLIGTDSPSALDHGHWIESSYSTWIST
jgi:hypothetical protein